MTRVKAVFFIPLADNDGRDLTAERVALEEEMYTLLFGWTRLGVVQGAYRMRDGQKAVDDHMAYMVVLDETRLGEVEDALRGFKSKTTQEAIYLEVLYNVDVRFV